MFAFAVIGLLLAAIAVDYVQAQARLPNISSPESLTSPRLSRMERARSY